MCVFFYALAPKWRPTCCLILSYFFYFTWSIKGAILLITLTTLAFFVGIAIETSNSLRVKRIYCGFFISSLIGILSIFKFNVELAHLSNSFENLNSTHFFANLIAPIGISYYLFKLISYILEVYWENQQAQKNFIWLALYTSFFPQIISGPIQRSESFFSQLKTDVSHSFDIKKFEYGAGLIFLGIIEKTVIADRIGTFVYKIDTSEVAWVPLLLSAYGYTLMLFSDFAGVTHVALGLGYLFSVKGPDNFNRPFSATNIQDFWRRWHMSLTTWLSDYVFLPLRMVFRNFGNFGLSISIMINLILIGIWHGSGWNYVAFGCLHGIFMIGSFLTLKKRNSFFKKYPALTKPRTIVGQIVTFHMVCLALLFFRYSSVSSAINVMLNIVTFKSGFHFSSQIDYTILISSLLAGLVAIYLSAGLSIPTYEEFSNKNRNHHWVIYTIAALIIALLGIDSGAQFIYAKF